MTDTSTETEPTHNVQDFFYGIAFTVGVISAYLAAVIGIVMLMSWGAPLGPS